jgi:hypothetical protein
MMSRERTKALWTKESRGIEKFIKKIPKNIIFPKGFLFNHGNFVGFHLKSQVPLKNVKTQSGSYSYSIHLCHKTELKSRWSVPFRSFFHIIISKCILG